MNIELRKRRILQHRFRLLSLFSSSLLRPRYNVCLPPPMVQNERISIPGRVLESSQLPLRSRLPAAKLLLSECRDFRYDCYWIVAAQILDFACETFKYGSRGGNLLFLCWSRPCFAGQIQHFAHIVGSHYATIDLLKM